MCDRDNNGKCDKVGTTEDNIRKMICRYDEIVSEIDLKKTSRGAGVLIIVLLILIIVTSVSFLFVSVVVAALIIAFVTMAVTIIVTLYQNGPSAVLKRNYETLETILFRLIDLEKDCRNSAESNKINALITTTLNKMNFK